VYPKREEGAQDRSVTNDLDTLLTALCVKIDDELGANRWMGRSPGLADSELICLAVAQALLGEHDEGGTRKPRPLSVESQLRATPGSTADAPPHTADG
jgi:hypothetical protein